MIQDQMSLHQRSSYGKTIQMCGSTEAIMEIFWSTLGKGSAKEK